MNRREDIEATCLYSEYCPEANILTMIRLHSYLNLSLLLHSKNCAKQVL